MSDFDKALERYEKAFDDIFPMFSFMGTEENEVINIINRCVAEKKDVYDLGYLQLNTIY